MDEMHLVIFHIGPVQDFIAAARRSRDLWFGSWLLSELAKAAALEIVKQHNNMLECLVFPAPADLKELKSDKFNVANRVVALVTHSPAELGKAVRKSVLKRLGELRDEAYANIKGEFKRDTATNQMNDLLEFFWASSSINISVDYDRARTRAETLLAVRKMTNDFKPVTWGSAVPKCSLDGCRESVIPERVYNEMTETQLRNKYGIRIGERLCGVELLKRNGSRGQDDSFFSTSHVAALTLLNRLTAQQHAGAVNEYIESLKKLKISPDALNRVPRPHAVFGHYDGRLLFEERLQEYFEEEKYLEQAKRALNNFLDKALDGRRPFPYYALLHADGDLMGMVINEQKTVEQHQKFSRCLSRFAREVRDIVDSHSGSLVYSGGDDVLAFVPLHTVLACARYLAENFRQQLADFKLLKNGKELTPTLSVGLVVVHHLTPLSDALALARLAEKAAKSIPGKNALAVTLSKRSGTECTVKGKWEEFDQQLEYFIELHRKDAIPDGAAYELQDLALTFETSDEKISTLMKQAAFQEAKRILRRKKAQRGSRLIGEDVLKKLDEYIGDEKLTSKKLSIKKLAEVLIVAREFAVAADLAGISLPVVPTGEEEKR